jgi:hypothetical protein
MEDIVTTERTASRISWRAIWIGLFVVMAVQILLQLFGVAIGVSVLRPSLRSVQGVSIWAGIWAIISTLSAFFFGGWTSSSLSQPLSRTTSMWMGAALWAFATTLGVLFLSSGMFGAIGLGRALLNPPGGNPSAGYAIGAAWAVFGTVLLSLVAAVAGGMLGSHELGRRRTVERYGTVTPPPVTTPPITTPPLKA